MESAKCTSLALKGPKCAQCRKPILTELATMADGKVYHTYHFQCVLCHKVLSEIYTTHRGQIYCTGCHEQIMDNPCAICKKPIDENCLEIMTCHYHYACFTCSSCKQPFDDGVFYPVGDEVFCLKHQWQARMDLEAKTGEAASKSNKPKKSGGKSPDDKTKKRTVET